MDEEKPENPKVVCFMKYKKTRQLQSGVFAEAVANTRASLDRVKANVEALGLLKDQKDEVFKMKVRTMVILIENIKSDYETLVAMYVSSSKDAP